MPTAEGISHKQWLESSIASLSAISDTAILDARVLLCHCLQQSLSYVLTWPERIIAAETLQQLSELLQRRLAGEPIAYLIGYREFWSMDFKVSPDVLIPRPETEHLVEWALNTIRHSGRENTVSFKVLELGTGSGAIAVALAKEEPQLTIVATDVSHSALNIARENAQLNLCSNINFLQGSWFDCVNDRHYDLIISNPPYIDAEDPHLGQGDLPYEPESALVAADSGLSDIKSLVANAAQYLNTDGWLGIEHGYEQGDAVSNLMQQHGYNSIQTIKDLAGIDRFTIGCRSNSDER